MAWNDLRTFKSNVFFKTRLLNVKKSFYFASEDSKLPLIFADLLFEFTTRLLKIHLCLLRATGGCSWQPMPDHSGSKTKTATALVTTPLQIQLPHNHSRHSHNLTWISVSYRTAVKGKGPNWGTTSSNNISIQAAVWILVNQLLEIWYSSMFRFFFFNTHFTRKHLVPQRTELVALSWFLTLSACCSFMTIDSITTTSCCLVSRAKL